MDIRIANIDSELLGIVKEDAKKNMRTIGKQVEYIIRKYYNQEKRVHFPPKQEMAIEESAKRTKPAWKFNEEIR